jgi:hypothetical protein
MMMRMGASAHFFAHPIYPRPVNREFSQEKSCDHLEKGRNDDAGRGDRRIKGFSDAL